MPTETPRARLEMTGRDIFHTRAIAAVVVDTEHVEQLLWLVIGGGQSRTAAETVSWYDQSGDHTVSVSKSGCRRVKCAKKPFGRGRLS